MTIRSAAGMALVALLIVLLPAQRAHAQVGGEHEARSADELEWNDFTVPGFPPGLRYAVVHGDPAGDGPYTLRASLPDGYRIPAHIHGMDEHLTVISGIFEFGHGERWNEAQLRPHGPGDYLYIPADMPHFARANGAVVFQLHGIGPFTTTVLEPLADEN
jgi:quercetin dioxygenase-like cupin family protein